MAGVARRARSAQAAKASRAPLRNEGGATASLAGHRPHTPEGDGFAGNEGESPHHSECGSVLSVYEGVAEGLSGLLFFPDSPEASND